MQPMSAFHLNALPPPAAVSPIRPVQPPKPSKAQSDHKPVNAASSSRGPAVVLSGALAKPPERQAAPSPPPAAPPATGQYVNRVI
jgi:hypothetical protein